MHADEWEGGELQRYWEAHYYSEGVCRNRQEAGIMMRKKGRNEGTRIKVCVGGRLCMVKGVE